MTKAAAKSGSSKPAGFKKQGKGAFDTVTIVPGDNSIMLDNIKQLADNYGAPKTAPIKSFDPKHPNRAQLENIKDWAASTGGQGDNPFSGK